MRHLSGSSLFTKVPVLGSHAQRVKKGYSEMSPALFSIKYIQIVLLIHTGITHANTAKKNEAVLNSAKALKIHLPTSSWNIYNHSYQATIFE